MRKSRRDLTGSRRMLRGRRVEKKTKMDEILARRTIFGKE
jgi:hypothetical protein